MINKHVISGAFFILVAIGMLFVKPEPARCIPPQPREIGPTPQLPVPPNPCLPVPLCLPGHPCTPPKPPGC